VSATPPRVSCVIPVHNGARFLGETLENVLAQTLPPAEVIVVDDGSTDATANVAKSFGAKIDYVFQSNAGAAAARNRGAARATGELLAFQDADDLWHEEKLARQAARFAARPELDVSICHIRNVWVAELANEEASLKGSALARDRPGYTAQALMLRRSTFERIGTLDESILHRDATDWLTRAIHLDAVLEVMPDVLVFRRIHEANMSRRRGADDEAEMLALARAMIERRRRKPAPPTQSNA
jgi:glycosyltransferase involved in cell wall biosynthesis